MKESHVKDYAQQIEEIEDSLDKAETVIFKRPDNDTTPSAATVYRQ